MHAVDIKRNATTRTAAVAAAVGVGATLVLGLILLDAGEQQALALPPVAAPAVDRFDRIELLRDSTLFHDYAASPARSAAEIQLMEENVEFQSHVNSRSYLDIQLAEENIEFQSQMSSPAASYLDIRWMEDNQSLPAYTGSSVRTHSNMEVEE